MTKEKIFLICLNLFRYVCMLSKNVFSRNLIFTMIIYFQFLQVARYSILLVGINGFVIWCMNMMVLVQMVAWEDELRNLTNSTTVIQYEMIENSIICCVFITYLTIQILYVCIIGFDEFIKFFREITWKMW